ncbi:MAG: hypothetical protein A2Y54_04040 [Chloroflexi bacterium RBG_16_51_16]|nr:MAG: hypothetical protein A2Y54_04040 [Chloroflexi bacterium RBG_16_51_16]
MNSTQKVVLAFLTVLAITLVGLVVYFSFKAYEYYMARPLGPALVLPAGSLIPLEATWTASPSPNISPFPSTTLAPTFTALPATPVNKVSCGGPEVMTLLVIGTDARGESYLYGLADVIRIVRLDFVTPKISVLEFPRDLWVSIPEIADDIHQDHEKLNQAYLYGNPGFGYYDHPSAGPGLLALTLYQNFGVITDHYGAINMRTFESMVDAVGGIDVTLEDTIDGRAGKDRNPNLVFPAGTQHLNGERALMLARIRIEGTFARADNQNLVLCALRKKLTRPDVVTKIPDLIGSFKGNVQTDLSLEQLSQLACLGSRVRPENILLTSFPTELFTPSNPRIYDPVFEKTVFTWDVDFGILRDYVSRFNQGTWPTKMAESIDSDEAPAYTCP